MGGLVGGAGAEQPQAMTAALRLSVRGVVQGVGFRPFVYGLAAELGLRGWVRNTSGGVEIAVQGPAAAVEQFQLRLRSEAPPLARLDAVDAHEDAAPVDCAGFAILPSAEQPESRQALPPDAALCPACERELFDPSDRRYLYPFISCTACGPRFTIISRLPCDRERTVMAAFPFCPACAAEYENPLDRRFHAQASACPACGPRFALKEDAAELSGLTAILRARRLLREGRIVAIKGIGGFHLACDAGNAAAVAKLRRRKHRPDKPFALMAADLAAIRAACQCSEAEAELLRSPARPIVLLERRQPESFPGIAPRLNHLGFLLPYTPLHLLLLAQNEPCLSQEPAPSILVMTSANRSGEPLAADNDEALSRLAPLADAFLLHDRPILARCDDSVAQGTALLRRSRGHAPAPLRLPFAASRPLLAVGGELKNTFCLAQGDQAFLSQHIGGLTNAETCAAFEQSIAQFSSLFHIQPECVAHDLHPQYFSTRYAQRLGIPCVAVQHHHAHIAACMADNGLSERQLIGLAFDGTGYGSDGTIWGGEVLLASYAGFERFAHLEYLPLPGGDTAIRKPWRIAVGYAHALGLDIEGLPFLRRISRQEEAIIRQQVDKQINTPRTSSMGRLFDAVASLLDICNEISYEGQAAIELETISQPFMASAAAYAVNWKELRGTLGISLKPLLQAVIDDVRAGTPAGLIGARFHRAIAQLALALCEHARRAAGLHEVALSGGVWQNQLLRCLACAGLAEAGFIVYVHRQVPANDGGLALGQAAVAQAALSQGFLC
ncbi:carbamoyltransferase HypF [Candidatus Electronema sp. JM]|uniref:carbamoyltransferase HypF n=1 Tax=Candidatus Electronema sp. JM TaxID=3401571 RepID=UPI003AA87C03